MALLKSFISGYIFFTFLLGYLIFDTLNWKYKVRHGLNRSLRRHSICEISLSVRIIRFVILLTLKRHLLHLLRLLLVSLSLYNFSLNIIKFFNRVIASLYMAPYTAYIRGCIFIYFVAVIKFIYICFSPREHYALRARSIVSHYSL